MIYVKYSFIWTKKCPKRLRHIFTTTHIRTSSCRHMVLTSWFKSSIFSLFFCSLGTFLVIFILLLFFVGLNACDMPVPMSGLHCGGSSWLASLNFMVDTPARTILNPHNELHSSRRVNNIYSDRNRFFVQQYRNYQRWFRMKYNVEIDKKILSLNQTVKTIPVQQTDRFLCKYV